MKRTFLFCLTFLLVFVMSINYVSAFETVTESDNINLKINVDFYDHPKIRDTVLRINLFSDTGVFLGMDEAWIGGITKNTEFNYTIDKIYENKNIIARYIGVNYLEYNNKKYYPEDELFLTAHNNETYSIKADKPFDIKTTVLFDGKEILYRMRPYIENDNIMVPVFETAFGFNLNAKRDFTYNSVPVYLGDKVVAFNIDSAITNVFGEDKYMKYPTVLKNDCIYIPVTYLAEYFNMPYEFKKEADEIKIDVKKPSFIDEYYKNIPINKENISSKTNYLLHIDKSDYNVILYKGSKNHWNEEKRFLCTIGAYNTPTITGEFEYFSKESIWDFDTYYVAPVMRFYNGYALHSTLMYSDGSTMDGRLGMMLSHGCVRLHPDDIKWLWDVVPLHTKVYITE